MTKLATTLKLKSTMKIPNFDDLPDLEPIIYHDFDVGHQSQSPE